LAALAVLSADAGLLVLIHYVKLTVLDCQDRPRKVQFSELQKLMCF